MKKLLFLLIITCVSTLGYTQEIPAKANTIIITLPDSNNIHEKVVKVFSDKGYTVKNNSKSSSKITTDQKTLKNTRIDLNAEIKGNEIFLRGRITIAAQSNMNIEYKGAKGTPVMNAWEEMDKVAKAFKGKLKYEIK